MTAITKDFIDINLSTDELMLKELERRDGIYSFIFHELEVPKAETPTASISPVKLIDRSYGATKAPTTNGNEISDNTDSSNGTDNNNASDKYKIRTETVLIQRSNVICHSNSTLTATATKTKTMIYTAPTTTTLINTSPNNKSPTAAEPATSSSAMPIILPSIFTTTPLSTTTACTTPITNGNVLPPAACFPSLSGINMRSYHEHFKTWHPPATLVYDNPKLYAYMANCGFRVRLATPRFSHISAPLVRNRRHALKETPQYKRMSEMCMCAPVADLRALFPLDPDVHAPFATSVGGVEDMTMTDVNAGVVELSETPCCVGGTLMQDTPLLK
ncbi:uncharacterized protein LOC105210554 [Zeugodacus cucurbitae]|uniref:uncharacterized protein LOC105210554 n=1 Tax=Zeugodacus cucurbitae TaxID=28588 RepID=UPI0005967FD5|nr:uncharacterized protein LOC105210554 [Zeugodacus cucurbitae]